MSMPDVQPKDVENAAGGQMGAAESACASMLEVAEEAVPPEPAPESLTSTMSTPPKADTGVVQHATSGATDAGDDPVVKTIILLRHSESIANVMSRASASTACLHDPHLTAEGERQARSWQQISREWGAQVVLCSPLRRSLHTALLAFDDAAGPPIEIVPLLREYHWESAQNRGNAAEVLQAEMAAWGGIDRVDPASLVCLDIPKLHWDPVAEACMSHEELKGRCRAVFESGQLTAELLSRPEKVVVAVSHYGTIHGLCDGAFARQFGHQPRLGHGGVKVQVHASSKWSVSILPCPAQQQQGRQASAAAAPVLCKFFAQGACQFGEACRFSHQSGMVPPVKDRRTASVLVVGRSQRLSSQWVALLGGAFNSAGLCWCDFGGGLEPYDRGRPHHAACRELAEELLSLGKRETGNKHSAKHAAQAVMRRCCAATGLSDEEFAQRHTHETPRGHSQMIMRAEWVDADGRSIDELHSSFVTNCEVKQVALVALHDLTRAISAGDDEVESVPVYSIVEQATGREWMLSSEDCERIEAARATKSIVDGVTGHGGSPVLVDPQCNTVLDLAAPTAGASGQQFLKRRDKLALRHCLAHNLDASWLMGWVRAWDAEDAARAPSG